MGSLESRRKTVFALSLGALIAWALILALARSGGSSPSAAPTATRLARSHRGDSAPGRRDRRAVAHAAMEFTDAYLGYEVGELSAPDRRALGRLTTAQLGAQLLGEPPRTPPSGSPPREWASRVQTIHVGIFDGSPALLVGVVVLGVNGAHVLTPTFVERGTEWLVAGLGA